MQPNDESSSHTPVAWLEWSLSRYQELDAFQAICHWSSNYEAEEANEGIEAARKPTIRTIHYQSPNRFRIVSDNQRGFVMTTVCDGQRIVEYTSHPDRPARSAAAPNAIAHAISMQMQHPMFCGTLLYQFFSGPTKVRSFADTGREPIAFGPDVVLDDQECRTIHLYAIGPYYGQTEIAISAQDGLVRRIRYNSEPLLEMMRDGAFREQILQAAIQAAIDKPELKDKMPDFSTFQMPMQSETTELYRDLVLNAPIPDDVFDTTLPER